MPSATAKEHDSVMDRVEVARVGIKAVKEASKPGVFPAVIALICLAGLGLLVYTDLKRSDAQVSAMAAIVTELQAQGIKLNEVHDWCCTVAPITRRPIHE